MRTLGYIGSAGLGALAGWLWGQSVAQSERSSGGPLGPGFATTVGLTMLVGAIVILLVLAGLLALSRRRRPISVALLLGTVALGASYALSLTLALQR